VPDSELVPADRHVRATEIILHIVNTYHYKKTTLDDQFSAGILHRYFDSLDPNRSFFTEKDIEGFNKYQYLLDDDLKQKKLEPAFEIFRLYRKRVLERVQYALKRLDSPFDFTLDEVFEFDRTDQPWPANNAELDEIWRKRVKNDYLSLMLSGKQPAEIKDQLVKRYTRVKTSTMQLESNDVYQTFINAYLMNIEPHTAYFSPRTSENFDISMRLSLEGIGAVLRSEYDYTTVQEIVPGGPADLAGELHKEDRIVGVGQDKDGKIVDVVGWRLDDVVDLIRGRKGTLVRLEVLPKSTGADGPTRMISIVRDKIKLEDQAAKSQEIELPEVGGRIGVIEVDTFYSDFEAQAAGDKDYKSTTRDVRKLLRQLKRDNIDGIIIDLRGNGGGSLSEALEFTGLFIDSGPVVQTKDASGRIEVNNDPDPGIEYSGPLAVLVDRNSASASEIFAGAIQDYRRGIIIGEPTFGKGTVQHIVDLNKFIRRSKEDHGRLKTTIAQFYRISGGSNQHKGVIPDIIFPTVKYDGKQGERALDNALPWDEIKPARFIAASAPTDNFAAAKERYEKRIKSEKLFQILLEQLALIDETGTEKTVSLLASVRKHEREALNLKKNKIENEFRVAEGLDPIPVNEDTIDDSEDTVDKQDDFKPKDVLLEETARILHDLITPSHTIASTLQQHIDNFKNQALTAD
jgi:carboxyl-terminal processing protease